MPDTLHLISLYAFDQPKTGKASTIGDDWPGLASDKADQYRWLHLDLSSTTLAPWLSEHTTEVVRNALTQSETRPRCDAEGEGILLNLRGVNLNADGQPEDMVSLRMWIQKGAILTTRMRKVFAVEAIAQSIEAGAGPNTVGKFLYALAKGLTDRIETLSLQMEDQTDALEEAILEDRSLDADAISQLRRSVIKLRRYIAPQKEALFHLVDVCGLVCTAKEAALLREVANRTARIVEELNAVHERLGVLQEHLAATAVARQGKISYLLSLIAAIFLPLGFLTGLFGVNLGGMPGIESPMAFAILCIVMVVIGVLSWVILWRNKWF